MANTTTTAAKKNEAEELVDIYIPREPGDESMFFVSVNDYQAALPRGKTSKVPKYVADEINLAREAKERFYETRDRLLAQSK